MLKNVFYGLIGLVYVVFVAFLIGVVTGFIQCTFENQTHTPLWYWWMSMVILSIVLLWPPLHITYGGRTIWPVFPTPFRSTLSWLFKPSTTVVTQMEIMMAGDEGRVKVFLNDDVPFTAYSTKKGIVYRDKHTGKFMPKAAVQAYL